MTALAANQRVIVCAVSTACRGDQPSGLMTANNRNNTGNPNADSATPSPTALAMLACGPSRPANGTAASISTIGATVRIRRRKAFLVRNRNPACILISRME